MKTPERVLKEWVNDRITFRFPKSNVRLRSYFTRSELTDFVTNNLEGQGEGAEILIVVEVLLGVHNLNKIRRRIKTKRFRFLLEPQNFARLESVHELYRLLGFRFRMRTIT